MNDDDFPPRLRSQSNALVKRLIEDVGRDGPSTARVTATVDGVLDRVGRQRHRWGDIEPAAPGFRQTGPRIRNNYGFTHLSLSL